MVRTSKAETTLVKSSNVTDPKWPGPTPASLERSAALFRPTDPSAPVPSPDLTFASFVLSLPRGPRVRIRLPPAPSPLRTRLSSVERRRRATGVLRQSRPDPARYHNQKFRQKSGSTAANSAVSAGPPDSRARSCLRSRCGTGRAPGWAATFRWAMTGA